MKKIALTCLVASFCTCLFAQELKKGNLIGVHTLTINLDPDVTLNQYLDAFKTKFLPEFEKNFPGWKAYLVKGSRGVDENRFGIFFMVENEEARDIYFDKDGQMNEKGAELFEKMRSATDEVNALGTWTSEYTDWVVQ